MRIQEHFTLRAWFRWPHRSVVMISSSPFNRKIFSIPVPGYNAAEMFAQRDVFTFAVDYIGVGESFRPADGREATREADIEALRKVFNYIRFFRWVPKIDLLAEGLVAASLRCGLLFRHQILHDLMTQVSRQFRRAPTKRRSNSALRLANTNRWTTDQSRARKACNG